MGCALLGVEVAVATSEKIAENMANGGIVLTSVEYLKE